MANSTKNKIFKLKFSFTDKIFRTMQVKGSKSLYDLAETIIEAFNFYNYDSEFGFYSNIKDYQHSDEIYELFVDMPEHESTPNAKSLKKTLISSVFVPQKQMLFLFDYKDKWKFLVECLEISDPIPKAYYPRSVERRGQAPNQY